MVKPKLPFLIFDRDRHGNLRVYVRFLGRHKIRLREKIGTPEFMAAYHRAIAGQTEPQNRHEGAAGSFRSLCVRYYRSTGFAQLDLGTQKWRRHHLDLVAGAHGDKPVAMLESRHVRRLRDEMKSRPAVANSRLKALRALFSWATEEEEAPHDPTVGVRPLRYVSEGHHSWTLEEV